MNMGMAACCTGVVFTKPMASTASRIHSDSAGVKALNARSTLVCGAIVQDLRSGTVRRDGVEGAPKLLLDKKVVAHSDWLAPHLKFEQGKSSLWRVSQSS